MKLPNFIGKYFLPDYKDPKKYWDERWKLKLSKEEITETKGLALKPDIEELMKNHRCENILEVGCGRAVLHELKGYVGLDFSREVIKQAYTTNIYQEDITKKIPFATNSKDTILSRFVLLHIPYAKIDSAVFEMCRVAKKLIILQEPWAEACIPSAKHCFSHNLPKLFERFNGYVAFLDVNA